MTAFAVGYALRMYAPRSTDPSETTILVPAAGAPHSDEFKVSSIERSGYKPYLDGTVPGRSGRINLLKRKLDIGSYTATLIDKTLTDNLTRWWTAFFGDVKGRPPGRLRVEMDETLDGGTTWSRFMTGELVGSRLVAKNQVALSLRERTETLKMKAFVGTPHSSITYASIPTLIPLGLRTSNYGNAVISSPLTGSTNYMPINGTDYKPAGEIAIGLDVASMNDPENVVTQELLTAMPPNTVITTAQDSQRGWLPKYTGRLRARVRQTSGGASGTEGDYQVGMLWRVVRSEARQATHYAVVGFMIKELKSTDAGYAAVPSAAGITVEISLYVEQEVSKSHPLLINDVDPAQLAQDLLDGKFGHIYRAPETLPTGKSYGDVARSVAHTGLAALEGIWPPFRGVMEESMPLIDFVEKYLLIPYHWAMYLDSEARVNFVDLRLPASLAGIPTLTDDDVIGEADVDWSHDPTQSIHRVDITRYTDRLRLAREYHEFAGGDLVKPLHAIEQNGHPLIPLFIGSIDYGDEVFTIDAKGYRSMEGEDLQGQPRSDYLDAKLLELANHLQRPFGYGLTTIPLTCRRTALVNAVTPGALRILDVDVVPDPATHKRGGPVVVRVLEKTPDGPHVQLLCAFMSSATVASAPSLTDPAQETNNTYTGITTTVTLNASSQPVEVRYAVTETSVGSIPADDSPLWTLADTVKATGSFAIRGLPPGKRIWVQGRSVPIGVDLQFPSAWTAAAGDARVDTASLPTPSSLAAPDPSDRTCLLTWTNGASDLPIELLLATPTGDPRSRIAILPAGTTRFTIHALTPSTTYRAEVRHALGQHHGSGDTEDFTTDASGSTVPAITRMQVIL